MSALPPESRPHFVTGKLAEKALRAILHDVAPRQSLDYSLQVLPITVAALMTPEWIAQRVQVPPQATHLVIPGYCGGDLQPLTQVVSVPVIVGPSDLFRLPQWLGQPQHRADFGAHRIQILAEINHAPRLARAEILAQARALANDGADVIDLGCDPGSTWSEVGDCVRQLCDEGLTVSIDSLNVTEIDQATRAGATLVLSVNRSNVAAAADWGVEVVAIPDDPKTLTGFDETIRRLERDQVAYCLDPILEPIGFGFGASLMRYADVRQRFPDAPMMMGIENLTELTECDSAAVNLLLMGLCAEWRVDRVLTTQVIPWAATSVRECDVARRVAHHAVEHGALPKHLDAGLLMLRDAQLPRRGATVLRELSERLRDRNIRLFVEDDGVHALSAHYHHSDHDVFRLFEHMLQHVPDRIDASHAFYLGYEMAKAQMAHQLGKAYEQDEALDWGILTVAEPSHRLASRRRPPQD